MVTRNSASGDSSEQSPGDAEYEHISLIAFLSWGAAGAWMLGGAALAALSIAWHHLGRAAHWG